MARCAIHTRSKERERGDMGLVATKPLLPCGLPSRSGVVVAGSISTGLLGMFISAAPGPSVVGCTCRPRGSSSTACWSCSLLPVSVL